MRVDGRTGGRKASKLRATFRSTDETGELRLRIRIDDTNDSPFWVELSFSYEDVIAALRGEEVCCEAS